MVIALVGFGLILNCLFSLLVLMQILSRKAHIDEKMYNQLVEKARNEGYDVTKLQKTHQSRTPPQADSTPQDTKGLWWIKSLLGT